MGGGAAREESCGNLAASDGGGEDIGASKKIKERRVQKVSAALCVGVALLSVKSNVFVT